MRRRSFLTLLGGAAAAWPLAARAQQRALPVVGYLSGQSSKSAERAFRQGLKESGYVEGENVTIEYRFADNQMDRLPPLAADLVRRRVAVIVAATGPVTAVAAKATTTIPIVFVVPEDPVRLGLVKSLARPGGNMTGINILLAELVAKRLGLLRELVPAAARVAVLVNPAEATIAETTLREVEPAARALGLQIQVLNASTSAEINAAFAAMARERPDALFVQSSPFFGTLPKAATSTIPVVFSTGVDPVQAGLVASFNRPGGNVTGVSYMSVELVGKRVSLLYSLLPEKARLAVLANPTTTLAFDSLTRNTQAAAEALGRELEVFIATNNSEIDQAFARIVESGARALIVNPNTLFLDRRVQLATLATRYALPTICPFRDHAEAGGLMSYGASVPGEYRDVGIYTGRILRGEKAAELPVMQPTKFEFVINLHTAKTLGLTVPATLLALADEVLE